MNFQWFSRNLVEIFTLRPSRNCVPLSIFFYPVQPSYELTTRVWSGEINSYSIPRHFSRRPSTEAEKFSR